MQLISGSYRLKFTVTVAPDSLVSFQYFEQDSEFFQ